MKAGRWKIYPDMLSRRKEKKVRFWYPSMPGPILVYKRRDKETFSQGDALSLKRASKGKQVMQGGSRSRKAGPGVLGVLRRREESLIIKRA